MFMSKSKLFKKSFKKKKFDPVSHTFGLSAGSPENVMFQKIDFLRSTSYVVFLKAHIKIRFLYNSVFPVTTNDGRNLIEIIFYLFDFKIILKSNI